MKKYHKYEVGYNKFLYEIQVRQYPDQPIVVSHFNEQDKILCIKVCNLLNDAFDHGHEKGLQSATEAFGAMIGLGE